MNAVDGAHRRFSQKIPVELFKGQSKSKVAGTITKVQQTFTRVKGSVRQSEDMLHEGPS